MDKVIRLDRKQFQCKRCGWQWFSRMDKPVLCPKCHSAYWSADRKDGGRKDE